MFQYNSAEQQAGYGVVTDRFVLLVGKAYPQALVIKLWELLDAPETEVEDALTELARRGMAHLPDFVLLELVDAATGGVRIAVRGTGFAVLGATHPRRYVAEAAASWVEASAQQVDGMILGVGELAEDDASETLPFKRGVVRTTRLFWGAPLPAGESAFVSELDSHTEPAQSTDVVPVAEPPVEEKTTLSPRRRRRAGREEPPPEERTLLSSRQQVARWELRFEFGMVMPIEGEVIVGRRPVAPPGSTARLKGLLSPEREISATHARLIAQSEGLLLQDLDSTNGTIVTIGDEKPVLLKGGEPKLLGEGDRVDFGDGNIAMCIRQN